MIFLEHFKLEKEKLPFYYNSELFIVYFVKNKEIIYFEKIIGIKNFTILPLNLILLLIIILKIDEIILIHNHLISLNSTEKLNFSKQDKIVFNKIKNFCKIFNIKLNYFLLTDYNCNYLLNLKSNFMLKQDNYYFNLLNLEEVKNLFNKYKIELKNNIFFNNLKVYNEYYFPEILLNSNEFLGLSFINFKENLFYTSSYLINKNNFNEIIKFLLKFIVTYNIDYTDIFIIKENNIKLLFYLQNLLKQINIENKIYKIINDYEKIEEINNYKNLFLFF